MAEALWAQGWPVRVWYWEGSGYSYSCQWTKAKKNHWNHIARGTLTTFCWVKHALPSVPTYSSCWCGLKHLPSPIQLRDGKMMMVVPAFHSTACAPQHIVFAPISGCNVAGGGRLLEPSLLHSSPTSGLPKMSPYILNIHNRLFLWTSGASNANILARPAVFFNSIVTF